MSVLPAALKQLIGEGARAREERAGASQSSNPGNQRKGIRIKVARARSDKGQSPVPISSSTRIKGRSNAGGK
eukprot:9731985-Alexandrium_andersonii.AAC.1